MQPVHCVEKKISRVFNSAKPYRDVKWVLHSSCAEGKRQSSKYDKSVHVAGWRKKRHTTSGLTRHEDEKKSPPLGLEAEKITLVAREFFTLTKLPTPSPWKSNGASLNSPGVLRFGLVRDVPPAAQDPNPCSGVIFPKIGNHVQGFFRKKYPFLAILSQKRTKLSIANPGSFENQTHSQGFFHENGIHV